MKLEAAEGLLEGVLGEVAEVGVGEVGLHGRFEAPIVFWESLPSRTSRHRVEINSGTTRTLTPKVSAAAQRALTCSDPSSST